MPKPPRRLKPLLVVLLGFLAFGMRGCPRPNFETQAERVDSLAATAPIFTLPEADRENGLIALFVDATRPGRTRWTAVFLDEDHPNRLLDGLYDAYRWCFAFHRVADLEDLEYVFADRAREPTHIAFPTTYAGTQEWDVAVATHLSAEIPFSEFEREGLRPIVHVNTWNHLFSNRAGLPAQVRERREAPVYSGGRARAETIYRATFWGF